MTENVLRARNLKTVDPQESNTCRSGVRSALHAAIQLPDEVD